MAASGAKQAFTEMLTSQRRAGTHGLKQRGNVVNPSVIV
jgi:hypothetical protein